MTITTYKNFQKRINSTKQPTGGTNVTALLKESTSLKNPVFQLVNADFEVNYVKWEDHYYYVTDIVSVDNDIYELYCSMDDLASHKSEIGSTQAYVERSSDEHHKEIIDRLIIGKGSVTTTRGFADKVFHNITEFKTSTTIPHVLIYSIGNIDLNNRSNYTTYGEGALFALSEHEMEGLTRNINGQGSTWSEIITSTFKPVQFMVSAMQFPFTISRKSGACPMYLGNYLAGLTDGSGTSHAFRAPDGLKQVIERQITIDGHPQAGSIGSWLNRAPYSRYTFHLEPFGEFTIDTDQIEIDTENNTISFGIKISVDLVTGLGVLELTGHRGTTGPSNRILHRVTAQVGSPLALSQVTTGGIQGAISTFASAAGTIGMAASGNEIGAVIGAASTVGSAAASAVPSVNRTGANGSYIAWEYGTPVIQATYVDVIDINPNEVGRPLCEKRTLSSLPGYIKCTNASVNMAGLEADKAVINNYLNSGFYYE